VNVLRRSQRWLRVCLRILRYSLGLLVMAILLQRSTYPLGLDWNAASVIVGGRHFDYVAWEINALATKAAQTLWGVHPFMEEADGSQYVRDYLADLDRARLLEAQIEMIYTDPAMADPDAETADLRIERDRLRDDLRGRQPLMESILEGQVAAVLVDEGFGLLGQLLPPISMHFTQVPNLLIVSPRDRIEFRVSITVDPLPLEEIVALEMQIEDELDMSSLVVPLGGMALFPAMILETTSLNWAVETFAHEWAHHYLFFFPLGLYYDFAGETRIINETVADIVGKEIARKVLERYYPDTLVKQPGPDVEARARLARYSMAAQQPFDFGAAMHRTRVTVDHLMDEVEIIQAKADGFRQQGHEEHAASYENFAEDVIVKSEEYMEARRIVFHENGFRIRRLNQAYFAFFGGYQAGIPGIGGEDPIGPAVEEIRQLSPDLPAFMTTMRTITTRDELLAARDALRAEQQTP
jgi:hypothetical protein